MDFKPEDFTPDSYVMVLTPAFVERWSQGSLRVRVLRGDRLWLITPVTPESDQFARVRCPNGWVGDIKRAYLRPLSILEAIGSALDDDRSIAD